MDDSHDPVRPEELDALFARFRALGPCALAVSGGSDSTALMVLYADWLRRRRAVAGDVTVLTVDHGLRSASAAEARAVAAAAKELGYRHAILRWEGPKPATGIQAAARTARYRLMGEYMRQHDLAVLLTAHTRDDQAETLLMRLARGSGLDGLAAMATVSSLGDHGPGRAEPGREGAPWIARPFLDVPKAALRATLSARGIGWIEDPSNAAPEFERSRLRAARGHLDALGLTPAMLALSAARLARARRAVEGLVDQVCDPRSDTVHVDPCGVVAIDRVGMRRAGEEVALRVLERAIAAAGGAGERVPLGKLEALLADLWAADAAASACPAGRWTLARALITAGPAMVEVAREPGRVPLPTLTVAPGRGAVWDGRFRVTVAPGYRGGPVEVRPLGETGLRTLRRLGLAAEGAAARAASTVPALWSKGEIVAAPPLRYWRSEALRNQLDAVFQGLGAVSVRASPPAAVAEESWSRR